MTTTAPSGFQTGFAVRPGLVVEAAHARDVCDAVADAAARGLQVHVHATGHGLPGAIEGGVLISTRRMDSVEIDPVRRTARIGAGVTWGQVIEAAAPHGLAPLNGSSPRSARSPTPSAAGSPSWPGSSGTRPTMCTPSTW